MNNPYRIGWPEDFIRFCLRTPMLAFVIISNVIVSFTSPEFRGLWYTPIAVLLLIVMIRFTYKKYGFKKVLTPNNKRV